MAMRHARDAFTPYPDGMRQRGFPARAVEAFPKGNEFCGRHSVMVDHTLTEKRPGEEEGSVRAHHAMTPAGQDTVQIRS